MLKQGGLRLRALDHLLDSIDEEDEVVPLSLFRLLFVDLRHTATSQLLNEVYSSTPVIYFRIASVCVRRILRLNVLISSCKATAFAVI